jgi:hypothetical protein
MRTSSQALLLAFLSFAAVPAFAVSISGPDLTISLSPATGTFHPTGATPDPGDCLSEYCVLYSGTLTDTDTDDSIVSLISATVSFNTNPATGSLTVDNTFLNDVPGILIGDPTFVYPSFPYYQYSGPVFGIDVAPGTSVGTYDGTLTIYMAGGTNDSGAGETFTANFSIGVTPEPSTANLLSNGLLMFAGWQGVRRKWRSSEVSR